MKKVSYFLVSLLISAYILGSVVPHEITTAGSLSDNRFASYYILDPETEKVLGTKGSIANNAPVQPDNKTEALDRQWLLQPSTNGGYYIRNLFSSKVLAYEGSSLVCKIENGEEDFLWLIEKYGQEYRIIRKTSGKVLTAKTGGFELYEPSHDSAGTWILERVNPDYPVPEPSPADTGGYMIGAMTCNLWPEGGRHWPNIYGYPNRKPVLEWYPEGDPVVTDWEIKMAVDHGVSFFVPVWYRARGNEGKPVSARFDHWIKSLDKARYAEYIEYFIMWDNANQSMSGLKDEKDFLENVVVYWIENYFNSDFYMKLDNRPIVSIFSITEFVNDLGGVEQTHKALEKADQLALDSGFDGILFLGQFCWGNPFTNRNDIMAYIGMEYSMSYHWPTFASGTTQGTQNPTAEEIITGHQLCWDGQAQGDLPNIITASMGWDSTPWGGFTSTRTWRLKPTEFQTVLQNAKTTMEAREGYGLDRRMILLDNWNEYGEGHYIFPTQQYGVGYLDAVKKVFENADFHVPETTASPTEPPSLSPTKTPTPTLTPSPTPKVDSKEASETTASDSHVEPVSEENSDMTSTSHEDSTSEITSGDETESDEDSPSKSFFTSIGFVVLIISVLLIGGLTAVYFLYYKKKVSDMPES